MLITEAVRLKRFSQVFQQSANSDYSSYLIGFFGLLQKHKSNYFKLLENTSNRTSLLATTELFTSNFMIA
jgi:hypothetical protein